ncbi:MAG: cell division protein FtsL [Desulfobacterales bacterium]
MKSVRKKSRNLKMIGIWMAIMVIFLAELLLYTWCRVQSVQLRYAISELTETHRRRITMQNNLKIELARLKSPHRIANIATSRLGLTMPTSEQVVIIP